MSADQQTCVLVRPAQDSDATDVARIHVESWRDSYPGILPDRFLLGMSQQRNARQWRRIIKSPQYDELLLVAARPTAAGQKLLGFGSAGKTRQPAMGLEGEVYTLYVASDWQGQGIGRMLLAGLFKALLGNGYGSALISVLSANPARFFYEAQGGKPLASMQETFAGKRIEQTFYGWDDLAGWLAANPAGGERNP